MKIAVVGGGISGLGAAWLLSQKHEVHLFESEPRLGGHAHTVDVQEGARSIAMDTGFLVYNELTYPHLTAFFKHLQVETIDSSMSLSIQIKDKNLEWAGANLNTIFGQRKNLFKWRFHKMLLEVLRFGREAEESLQLALRHAWTLGELLKARRFAPQFASDYLLPIGGAIWSTPESKMLEFPAATFLTFFINHKLLQVNNRPIWKTVKNGSRQYVDRAAKSISHIHVGTPVVAVERVNGKVHVRTNTESVEFDRVVMGTHAPITARILKVQSDQEKNVLEAIQYEANKTYLHHDESCMPQEKRCWSAWNVYGAKENEHMRKISLSYYLNELQKFPATKNYFLTLNPSFAIETTVREFEYAHPQFDQRAIRAQRELPQIQGHGGVYYAGAWSRYGFHEDGLLSAVNVADLMGVKTPWSLS